MPAITSRASMPAARTGSLPAARRNGVTEIASSGRTRAEPPMFVAAYWWTVHPGKEKQFRAAWRRGTELIRRKYGQLARKSVVEGTRVSVRVGLGGCRHHQ